jgi:glycerate kinase
VRIVVAPDKFKGSLGAAAVAETIAAALREALDGAEIVTIPMADGGEGTVDAFRDAGALVLTAAVEGPLGEALDARFALEGDAAIVEVAAASGFSLLSADRRDPRRASSYGTGQLVKAALDAGAKHVVIGLGGSAVNDGGAGFLQALGYRFLDELGAELPRGGAALALLDRIDPSHADPRLGGLTFEGACDVENPLCGPLGASAVFGPQKGASEEMVAQLDAALARFADVSARLLGRDARDLPGAGAAGGFGYALAQFFRARLRSGAEIVAELCGLGAALDGAALCISGEGRIDSQTLAGKTVAGVARFARARGVPVVAFCGSLEPGVEPSLAQIGVVCFPIAERPMTEEEAMHDAAPMLRRATLRFARTAKLSLRQKEAPAAAV